jgi:hypothetical protein
MSSTPFEKSVRLFEALGEASLESGLTLREELKLGGGISLWDIVASYLVLYRFPLFFSPSDASGRKRFQQFLWPYRGLATRLRDALQNRPIRQASACPTWRGGNPEVLFLALTPLFYRDVLEPVAQRLTGLGLTSGTVLTLQARPESPQGQADMLRRESLWDHWSDETGLLAATRSECLQQLKRRLLSPASISRLCRTIGVDIDPVCLQSEFRWLFWREFPRLIPQLAGAEHFMKRHGPALVVSADDADQQCRAFLMAARQSSIPTLVIQQGFTSSWYPDWRFFCADAVAAIGPTSLTILHEQGVPLERITVTGHPGFDRLVRRDDPVIERMRLKLGATGHQRLVLFASQPYYVGAFRSPAIRRDMIRAVVDAAAALPQVRLVIKPHPRDDVAELKAAARKSPGVSVVDKDWDISDLIQACDVMITFFSQSALQALYAGKPVISVRFPDSYDASLYQESGATWVARSTEEIIGHLRVLTGESGTEALRVKEEARQRFVRQWAHVPDGRATDRVIEMIQGMLAGGKVGT